MCGRTGARAVFPALSGSRCGSGGYSPPCPLAAGAAGVALLGFHLPRAGPLNVCAHGGYLVAAVLVAFLSAGTDRVPPMDKAAIVIIETSCDSSFSATS